jgi:hypothetical protein
MIYIFVKRSPRLVELFSSLPWGLLHFGMQQDLSIVRRTQAARTAGQAVLEKLLATG